jgi:hypothetical protein
MAAQTLLPAEGWMKWFRPQAYDAHVARTVDGDLAGEIGAAEQAVAEVLAQRPVMAEDGRWCPRCAATYQAGTSKCADCSVQLLTASQSLAASARLRPAPSLS